MDYSSRDAMPLPTIISLNATPTPNTRATSRNFSKIAENGDDMSSLPATSVPLSMPAILQNAKSPRFAHLHNVHLKLPSSSSKKKDSLGDENGEKRLGGKRRRRRYENAQLAGNPHVSRPSRRDYDPAPPMNLNKTFAPPPVSFSRSTFLPSACPTSTPSLHGQFSLSLKGVRKTLLKSTGRTKGEGGRTEQILQIIENEIVEWLSIKGRIPTGYYHHYSTSGSKGRLIDDTPVEIAPKSEDSLFDVLPDLPTHSTKEQESQSHSSRTHIHTSPPLPRTRPAIAETSRTPACLTWLIPDPYTRFLTHVLARYYCLHSYSAPIPPGMTSAMDRASSSSLPSSPAAPTILPSSSVHQYDRITYITKPQMSRTDIETVLGELETPPGTDWSDIGSGRSRVRAERGADSATGFTTTTEEAEEDDTASEVGFKLGQNDVDTEGDWELIDDRTMTTFFDDSNRAPNVDDQPLPYHHLSSGGEEFITDDEASTDDEYREGELDSLTSSLASLPPLDPYPTGNSLHSLAERVAENIRGADNPSREATVASTLVEGTSRVPLLPSIAGVSTPRSTGEDFKALLLHSNSSVRNAQTRTPETTMMTPTPPLRSTLSSPQPISYRSTNLSGVNSSRESSPDGGATRTPVPTSRLNTALTSQDKSLGNGTNVLMRSGRRRREGRAGVGVGVGSGSEWKMPQKTFLNFLFD